MAKSGAERHAEYHQKVRTGELKRIQVYVPSEVGMKAKQLAEASGCSQRDLFVRLIVEEWDRQGSSSDREVQQTKKPVRQRTNKKRKPISNQRSEWYEVADKHRGEIEALARQGKKPTEIAAVISEKTGVNISGGFLNGYFGGYPWWTAGKG